MIIPKPALSWLSVAYAPRNPLPLCEGLSHSLGVNPPYAQLAQPHCRLNSRFETNLNWFFHSHWQYWCQAAPWELFRGSVVRPPGLPSPQHPSKLARREGRNTNIISIIHEIVDGIRSRQRGAGVAGDTVPGRSSFSSCDNVSNTT